MTKFEKDFKKWVRENKELYPEHTNPYAFKTLPDSMKWGVYVDFFDSMGMWIEIFYDWRNKYFYGHISQGINSISGSRLPNCSTRTQSRKATLEKAIEIYNTQ